MILHRQIGPLVLERSRSYPVVSITGPRQSGKTTLAQVLFPDYTYVSLERPDHRAFALEDPNRFLGMFKEGVVLDEVQRTPKLFSYIKVLVDQSGRSCRYVLTGSQNFLLLGGISQSLAGRTTIFKLLPFSTTELQTSVYAHQEIDTYLFTGGYPPIYDHGYDPHIWHLDYIQTYLERDVRMIRNVTNLGLFQKFLALCAGRVGQLLNLNSLAVECGISHNTANDWISVLEASYIIFRLPPYYQNFNKRVVKQPKLYFFDSGLLCALLGVQRSEQLAQHYLRGHIFESFIVSELVKSRWGAGASGLGYFWRDRHGHEIDYLIETRDRVIPVEINSGATIRSSMLNGLAYWSKLTGSDPEGGYLIYGGNESQIRSKGHVLGWKKLDRIWK